MIRPKSLHVESSFPVSTYAIGFGLFYLTGLIFALSSNQPQLFVPIIFFMIANMILSFLILAYVDLRETFINVLYFSFLLIFIGKAFGLLYYGYDTHYVWTILKVVVTEQDYRNALLHVSWAHFILVVTLFLISQTRKKSVEQQNLVFQLSNQSVVFILIATLVWIVLSSYIMLEFGVAVMGTDGVSLPYKFSAILFYSRTIFLPLLFLFLLQTKMEEGSVFSARLTLIIYFLLVVSEVFVRATKAPLFQFSLLLLILFSSTTRRHAMRVLLGGRWLPILCLLIAISAMPLVDVYRSLVTQSFGVEYFSLELNEYLLEASHSSQSFIGISIERFFHRLVGFTQFLGLVSDGDFNHSLEFILQYNSITDYYTKFYLGYDIQGHSSSPSLLGSLYILGGKFGGPILFSLYIALLWLTWRTASKASQFSVPLRCFIAHEVVISMMGGNLEMMFLHLFLAGLSVVLLRVLFRPLWLRPIKELR